MILRRLALMAGVIVLALCVALAGIGYWAGHEIISSFTDQLVEHFVDDSQDSVGTEVARSQRVLTRVTADITRYDIALDDPLAVRRELYAVLSGEPRIGRLFFGNAAGGLAGISRLPDGRLVFLMTDSFRPGILRQYDAASDGQLGTLRDSGAVFDARQRSWYQPAKDKQGRYWTAPYLGPDELGYRVSLAAPIFDAGGKFAGVIGTDLPLSVIASNVQSASGIGPHARSFIIDSAGRLIASSGGVVPVVPGQDGNGQLVPAANAVDPVVSGAAGYLAARPAILGRLQEGRAHVFSFNASMLGETHAAVLRFQSFGGSAWTLVSAVPEADFLAPTRHAFMFSLLMSVLVAVLALGLGSRIAAMTLRPLTVLTDTARAITRGEWPEIPEIGSNNEIGLLARAFRNMIASLRETQNELRLSEENYRSIVENALEGIIRIAHDGRVMTANPALARMLGYASPDEMIAARTAEAELDRANRQARDARLATLLNQDVVTGYETTLHGKEGKSVEVLLSSRLVRDAAGAPVYTETFITDLTERKRAEEALRAMQTELAHANRVATVGQLTSSIAHEVSQPVAATVINAQAALRWLGATPPALAEAQGSLEKIVRDGHRARDVIDRIRALIKKGPPRKDRLDINAAIREVIELTRVETVRNGVLMRTNLAGGLPLIECDRVQLQQVLLNLIVNAIEAMSGLSEGIRELSIATSRAEPDGVLVAVADSGPGMAPAALEHFFEAFYTTKPGGLGLGLSICRTIVEGHGGRLWVSTNMPRGTIFFFTMPACPEGAPAAA